MALNISNEKDYFDESAFQPVWSQEMTQRRLNAYYMAPHTFTQPQLEQLHQHANHYGQEIKETPQTEQNDDIRLGRLLAKLGQGFFTGMTTFQVGDEPRNEAEAITSSLGNLAGFVGYIPTAPLKLLNATKLVGAAQAMKGKSVPMLAATTAQNLVKPLAKDLIDKAAVMRAGAVKDAAKFVASDTPAHIIEGAFHLGVASGVSAWQHGVDEVIRSTAWGGFTGGAFRGIATMIDRGGARTLVKTVEKDHAGRPKPAKQVLTVTQQEDKLLRGFAGALFDGLPSTLRGDTTAQQVYHYLLGAYFGAQETTATEARRNKFLQKIDNTNSETIRSAQKAGVEKGYTGDKLKDYIMNETSDQLNFVPELVPGWDKLSDPVKDSVKEEALALWGTKSDSRYAGLKVLEDALGLTSEEILEEPPPTGYELTGKLHHGERLMTPKQSIIDDTRDIWVMGSGGARGADTVWSKVANRWTPKVDTIVHYSYKGHRVNKDAKGIRHELTDSQLAEANDTLAKAEKRLNKKVGRKTEKLQQRNFYQVQGSDGIFAIGEIVRTPPKKGKDPTPVGEVRGGTGWAVAMAKEMGGRQIHVYDIKKKGWYKYNRRKRQWETEGTPKLTKDFAGIGTRGVGKNKAWKKEWTKVIEDVFENTFGPAVQKSKEQRDKIQADRKAAAEATAENKSKAKSKKIATEIAGDDIPDEEFQDASSILGGGGKKKKTAAGETVNDAEQNSGELKQTSTTPVTDRNVAFVERELPHLHKNSTKKIYKLAKDYGKIINKYTGPKYRHNIDESMESIKADFKKKFKGTSLGKDKEGMIRQQLFMRNAGIDVPVYSVHNNKLLDKPLARKNMAHNDKRQRSAIMEIDWIWHGHNMKGRAYGVIDHQTQMDKKGRIRERSLSRIRQDLGDERYFTFLRGVQKQMMEKNGMYMYGGRADGDKLYFVKFHPSTPRRKANIDDMLTHAGIDLDNSGVALNDTHGSEGDYNKMKLSNLLYDVELNGFTPDKAGITKLMKMPDRIGKKKGLIDWNKRQQIWFTNGYNADRSYFQRADVVKDLGLENDEFKLILFEDAPGKDLTAKSLANKYTEATDGMIIAEERFVDHLNRSFGMPESGQNKSFIVSPNPKYGGLLGKFMFHKATPEASKWMRETGVNFMMPESAAKQRGYRDMVGFTSVGKDGAPILKDKKGRRIPDIKATDLIYGIDIGDIRGVLSEKDTNHQIENQRLPKQMLTNLTQWAYSVGADPAAREKYQKTMDDMFEEIIGKHFRGDVEPGGYNQQLKDLLDGYGGLDESVRTSKIEDLVRNIDKIGVRELMEAIKTPYAPEFTTKAYRKILKKTDEIIMDQVNDGEMSQQDANQYFQNTETFKTVMDRMLQLEQHMGELSTPIWFHKFTRDYRMQAMRNFVVYQVTRPQMPNSMSGRMRGYDPWMRAKFPKLNSKDNIFLMDNMYEDMKVDLPEGILNKSDAKKYKTLGKLWEYYQSEGKKNTKLRDFFNAVVMRVPMDSLSGAHDLKFAGFTGVQGKGIMLHPRTMQALGGADLDGDKAFAFFGMKKKYRDLYGKNKYEFSTTGDDKGIIRDNKKDFRDILAESNEETLKQFKDVGNLYDPYLRQEISSRAVDGRNRLGVAVTNRQSFIAMHSALAGTNTTDVVPFKMKIKNKLHEWNVTIVPKTDPKELDYARQLMRASIAFPSDPLDEGGLKSPEVFQKEVFKSLFDVKMPKAMKDLVDIGDFWDNNIGPKKRKTGVNQVINNSMFKQLKDMNSAYYSRNWAEGRRWYYPEIKDMSEPIYTDFTMEQRNSMITKAVAELGNIDWSDNVFNRIDLDIKAKVHDVWALKKKDLDKLKIQLGRGSFSVSWNPKGPLAKTLEHDLHTIDGRNAAVTSEAKFRKVVAGSHILMEKGSTENIKKLWWRRKKIEEFYRLAEDAIVRDMSDIVSFEMLHDYILKHPEGKKVPRRIVEELSKFAQNIKRYNTINLNNRKNVTDADIFDEKQTSFEDSLELDQWITNYKKGLGKTGKGTVNKIGRPLTQIEQDILDVMLVGTADRYRLDQIDKFTSKNRNLTPHELTVLAHERVKASGTSLNKGGIGSQSVSDKVVLELMNRYAAKFGQDIPPPVPDKVAKESNKKAAEDPLKVKVKDEETGEESTIEIDDNPYSGFEYLGQGVIKDKELKGLVRMLADNIKFYQHAFGDTPQERVKNVNLFTRGVVNKDLAAMNKEDYRIINRYLNDLRSGTWWQRNVVNNVRKTGIIPKRAYMQFPLAVARERMQNDLRLTMEQGYFQDFEGRPKVGAVARPTHYLERQQFFVGRTTDLATKYEEEQTEAFRSELMKKTGFESIEEGEALYEIAVVQREKGIINSMLADKNGSAFDSVIDYKILQYRNSEKETYEKYPWDEWKNKKFNVAIGEKTKNLTGQQIVDSINQVITQRAKSIHEGWISKTQKNLDKFRAKDRFHDHNNTIPKYDIAKFTNYIDKQLKEGKPLDMTEFGLDGLREISRSMMLQSRETPPDLFKAMIKQDVDSTGAFDFNNYYPHAHMDSKKAIESLKRGLDFLDSSPLDPTQKEAEKRKLLVRVKTLTGEWLPDDMVETAQYDQALRDIAAGKKGDWLQFFNSNPRTGNMMSRNNHLGGWEKDPGVWEMYQSQLIKTYYRQLSQIMNRATIDEFITQSYKQKKPVEWTRSWANFYKLYAQDSAGFPVNIPQEFLTKDSPMNIKGTPYGWWADSNVRRVLNNVRKKLGFQEDARLPEELQGIDVSSLRHWSNIEAKYQMATLLAHPKSSINNLYGGTLHTIQSVGWQNWRNARNVDYLRVNLPGEAKNFKAREDVTKWAISHGIVPDFIQQEAGLSPNFKKGKFRDFYNDAIKLIRQDPSVKDRTLLDLAKKHKITESAFQKAAWFMREPERALRRDAFVAHYLQARENIGSAEMDLNHPFLIEQAKKGVKATQFLYSAPYRPAFARSALGKVMTRFHLWAWNSVRFRKDIINEADKYGWRQGTPEFDRFVRMQTSDMFVLGLANIFAYSLFDNSLPQPWGWFQDTADWIFGSERERDRAFFGAYPTAIAPLQAITPPIARIGPAAFTAFVNNDYARLTDYYIPSMLPFGRIGRSIKKTWDNPIRGVEEFTGLPYGQFHREVKEFREDDG